MSALRRISRILHSCKSALIGLMRNDASVEIWHFRSFVPSSLRRHRSVNNGFSWRYYVYIYLYVHILMQDVCIYIHVTKYPPWNQHEIAPENRPKAKKGKETWNSSSHTIHELRCVKLWVSGRRPPNCTPFSTWPDPRHDVSSPWSPVPPPSWNLLLRPGRIPEMQGWFDRDDRGGYQGILEWNLK